MPSRNINPKQGNAKALRAKRKREPQVHENAKTAIIIKGRKTSQDVADALKDIVSGVQLSVCAMCHVPPASECPGSLPCAVSCARVRLAW